MKELRDGEIIWSQPYDLVDKQGKSVAPGKSDWDYTPRKEKCRYQKKYCNKNAAIKKEEKKDMSTSEQAPVSHETSPSAEVVQPTEKETKPVVSIPSTPDIAQLKNAIPQTGSDTVTVILSAIAVMGGATAWKFYTQKSKLAHEERMKQLENESNKNDNHEVCKATSATLSTRITVLEDKLERVGSKVDEKLDKLDSQINEMDAKVTKVEKSSVSVGGVDLDELEERVEKLEKSTKKKAASKV